MKQLSVRWVEYTIGILATAMIAAGILLYALQEPERIVMAQQAQIGVELDAGASLYAENCAVCHGLAGEGIGATPALNSETLAQVGYEDLAKTISRGLYGTAMPAWSKTDGGPLSDYQIGQLVTLIQLGDWQAVQDRVVNLGLAPRIPFTTQADPAVLQSVAALPEGEALAQALQVYARECVACHGADGLGSSLAPAINAPVVAEKPAETLERTLRSGVAGTLMASWQQVLSGEQIMALVSLLQRWDEVPVGAVPAPERPVPVTEESLALGAELYSLNCARCHGPQGQGTPRAPALNVKGFLEATADGAIQQIVSLGVPGTAMPAWGDRLGEAEIMALVGFIRAWEPDAPEVAQPARGGGPAWRTGGGSGGGQSGPPWMRSNTGSSQAPALPGGGQSAAQGAAPGQAQGSSSQSSAGKAAENTGQGQSASTQAHTSGQGGGPPWVTSAQTPTWWQALDWRQAALAGSAGGAALLLIAVGWLGLRRLPA